MLVLGLQIKTYLSTCFILNGFLLSSPSLSPSSALSCHALPVVVPFSLVAFSLPLFLLTASLCLCISLLWRMQTGGAGALLRGAKQGRQEAFRRCL